jgi:hypothetical protein
MFCLPVKILPVVFLGVIACSAGGDTTQCGFPVAAQFSEDMVTLSWGAVAGASAFNVYADYGYGRKKVNFAPVASRNRFILLWADSTGKRERVVKGNRVECRIVPLVAHADGGDTVLSEASPSCPVYNDYFRGFSRVLSDTACRRILQPRQLTKKIFPAAGSVSRLRFCSRYGRPARDVYMLYTSKIDPKDEGACVPFSTIVAKYFTKRGITCYRVQGLFMDEFHSFNLVVVEGVEYILDFTADQFVPGSSPVFMPRDFCFADSCGEPTQHPRGTFTPFYRVDKVFDAGQIDFSDNPKARAYRRLLDSLEAR